jgi:hypothetical protein
MKSICQVLIFFTFVILAAGQAATNCSIGCPCPDAFLDVPKLSVKSILVEVSRLQARINLDAKVSSLLSLTAGVDVDVQDVKINITGVEAQLALTVRLGNVVAAVDRVMDSLDRNPNLLADVITSLTNLLSTVLNGTQVVQRLVDSLGNIVVRVLDDVTGRVLSQTIGGLVTNFNLLSNLTNTVGNFVLKYDDPESANCIEVIQDIAGRILGTSIVRC